MKVLTYRSYKEHFELYTEILGTTAVDSSHIKLIKIYKIVLEDNT